MFYQPSRKNCNSKLSPEQHRKTLLSRCWRLAFVLPEPGRRITPSMLCLRSCTLGLHRLLLTRRRFKVHTVFSRLLSWYCFPWYQTYVSGAEVALQSRVRAISLVILHLIHDIFVRRSRVLHDFEIRKLFYCILFVLERSGRLADIYASARIATWRVVVVVARSTLIAMLFPPSLPHRFCA